MRSSLVTCQEPYSRSEDCRWNTTPLHEAILHSPPTTRQRHVGFACSLPHRSTCVTMSGMVVVPSYGRLVLVRPGFFLGSWVSFRRRDSCRRSAGRTTCSRLAKMRFTSFHCCCQRGSSLK